MSEPRRPTDGPFVDATVVVGPTAPGPLDGVRVAVKDLYDIAGAVTGGGCPAWSAGRAPAIRHADAVARLLAAGATVVGKTHTDELAAGMFGTNPHLGTPINPRSPERVPGGSSSGSAAAVAAGLAELGLGSDTGGSVRVPAAFCGLYGLRPTHGRVDSAGLVPMARGFDTVGWLAAAPAVALAAGTVLLGAGCGDVRPPSRLLLATDLVGLAGTAVADRTVDVARGLGIGAGAEVSLCPAGVHEVTEAFWTLMSRQLWETHGAWVHDEQPAISAGLRDRVLAAAAVTDEQVAAARAVQARLRQHLARLLGGDGAVVLPTTIDLAPRRDAADDELLAYRGANLALTTPASLAGAPQLAIPAGPLEDGEASVSLLAAPGCDELLLGTLQGPIGTVR
ncbi:MAG: amidase family protein [Acidimicrobiia bacterium]